jgi:hypothetical protein
MNKKELVQYAKSAKRLHKDDVIVKVCAGKSVLDVGCIGQDRDFTSDNWLHNKVKKVASHTDGVDVLLHEITALKQKGYSMYSVDELRKTKNRYDIVLIADVVEHVDDPVNFLKIYSSFLSENGLMVITTPNSNRANNFVNILFNNNYSVNPEHTCWFCPRTFSEVASRAELTVNEFFWGHHYFGSEQVKGLYQKFKMWLSNILISARTNFSPNMIFMLSKNPDHGRRTA